MSSLKNKNCLIYDASFDLGPDYISGLLNRGANVIAISSDSDDLLSNLIGKVDRELVESRLTKIECVNEELEFYLKESIGDRAIDILIFNDKRSLHPNVDALEYGIDDWKFTFNHNVQKAFELTKYLSPNLKRAERGSILFVSTSSSMVTISNEHIKVSPAYEAANSALNRLAKRLAYELGQFGINVNTLCVGNVDKDGIHKLIENLSVESQSSNEDILNVITSKQVIKGLIPIDQVVSQLCHLVSDESSYITGHDLFISGGMEI